ncbi:hypothetical protein NWP21_18685 [Anabaenopsis sp. FSS-46]|uniref:hypothetical protein n=1 Tax=Anabaenopsis sp. FSS-46 TaxID=2971766 RepID=UPI0024730351|nr:hypothetical protein [Anabaenopsis sp. FSS-46]MDH6100825.1 hypothetical protein [Anabaenopsis sp. FSS-46]
MRGRSLHHTSRHSDFERVVLEEIYQGGYKLPDTAQKFIPEADCKPDFVYEQEAIAIFCDGSVHDSPEQKRQDQIQRDNLKYNTAYQVVTLRYDQDWREKLNILPRF